MQLPQPITSRTNAKVKALRAAFEGRASKPGEIVAIEGATLIGEAVRSGIRPETVFVRQGSEAVLEGFRELAGVPVVVLSRDVFASAVDTNSPQGLAALVAIPEVRSGKHYTERGLVLVLEAIQDPGNLGTLLRAAEAFGASRLLITPETVNPWSPKALRASAGSVFRVPVRRMPLNEIGQWAEDEGIRVYAAVARANGAVSAIEADFAWPCAVMIGNEGAGLSEAALKIAGERIHIPCMTESLNAAAAGATLMYEAMRQRIVNTIPAGAPR
ncbi:MAG TPA: RNA methyltransferase [Acidobacteriaceae bacterium]|nr:RNA methyltransferase [Acidobacteriaceae bacterium]